MDTEQRTLDLTTFSTKILLVTDRNGQTHEIDPFIVDGVIIKGPEDIPKLREVLGEWTADMKSPDLLRVYGQCQVLIKELIDELKKGGVPISTSPLSTMSTSKQSSDGVIIPDYSQKPASTEQ